jgi:diguanylate cyclase (GGDEF)-like protein/PAS domain S-box-containing protein
VNEGVSLDAVPCGIVMTNAEDIIVHANETFLTWTGFQTSDLAGRTFASLLDSGSQAFYATQYQDELWAQHSVREIAFTIVCADGRELPVRSNSQATDAADREDQTVVIALFDSRSQQDYEREMLTAKRAAEVSEAKLRMLQESAARFLTSHNDSELAEQLALTLRESFDAAEVGVVTYNTDGSSFHIIYGPELRAVIDAVRSSRTDDQKALLADQFIVIRDIEEAFARSNETGRELRAVRGASYIGVPISDGDRVLGAFVAIFGRARDFDTTTRASFLALARQTGLAFSRVRLQRQLQDLASRDPLTGVANRFTIDQAIEDAISVSNETGAPLSLIFLDLDGFKTINDTLGHRAGDKVLQVTARRIRDTIRDSDLIGRFGGDEFLILCPGASPAVALSIADRIAKSVRSPITEVSATAVISTSMGIANYDPATGSGQTADSLTGLADLAMYESKRDGKAQITASI